MELALPENWTWTTLGEIAFISPRHPATLAPALQVSFVPMQGVSENSWRFKFQEVRTLAETRSGFTHFAEGDVLLAKITPCMENGKAAIARGLTNGLGCGTTELHVFRPTGGIQAEYLYHFLHQETFRQEARNNMTGTAGQLRVPTDFVKKTVLPLPPLGEQRRIVAKLEQLLSRVQACQERLEKIPQILKRFRQSVLAAACSGRLTEDWREKNPDAFEWETKSLGDITEIQGGIQKTPQRSPVKNVYPYLRVANVYRNRLALENIEYFELWEGEIEKFALACGDILVVEGNGSKDEIGRVGIWREEIKNCVHQNHIIRCRPKSQFCIPEYVMYFLNSNIGMDIMVELSVTTAGLYSLSTGKLKKIPVPLPPLAEQHEIVRRVESLFQLADRIETRYHQARSHVDQLTQSILAKAFRGELVPQDPKDEPASVLLEKIRQERAAQKPSRATRKARQG